ncbi:uncharacterized protein V1518DRAFT_424198, partial [Limtongia smithiae]|uniref:uncharacterized protein n=1 Tax=Limtongia smithiae TaxID=1125753 RepID=UPI0034CF9D14
GAEDVQWACTAQGMPNDFILGRTNVECEGYSSADDPYILRGSCAVHYGIYLTSAGRARSSEKRTQSVIIIASVFSGLSLIFVGIMGYVILIDIRQGRARRIAQLDLDTYSVVDAKWLGCIDELPKEGSTDSVVSDVPPPYGSIDDYVPPYEAVQPKSALPAEAQDLNEQQNRPLDPIADPSVSCNATAAAVKCTPWRLAVRVCFFPFFVMYNIYDHLVTPSSREIEYFRWCLRHVRDHPYCVLPAHVEAMRAFTGAGSSDDSVESLVLINASSRSSSSRHSHHNHSSYSHHASSSTHSSTGYGGTSRR